MVENQLKRTYLVIDRLRVYCEYCIDQGKPAMFLIHGFASSTYTFHRLIPLLKEHFSIFAIDLPGFGRSDKSTSFTYSFQNYAQLVAKCLKYFGLERVIIVGHSMGGQIALYTAKLVPDQVDKLVLLNSSGYLKKVKKSLMYSSYMPFFPAFVQWYVGRKEVKDYLENVLYNKALITADMVEEFGRPLKERNFYKSLVRLARHREGDLTTEQLRDIRKPTLLLWGEEDKVVPVAVGRRLVKELPEAELITYKHTGHLLSIEKPLDVVTDIVRYTCRTNLV
ncbi:alpha/beta hydrolase [Alkalihalobacillus oceani]|uniref:alpha/beta fold hydrolase n=1 Tax=Halalkalibacter oceani TaxID=1653776 RepID=UPI00203BE25B|nr:alpha/beta hydrolase [Halalkalibacter oceani]MCM3759880.1 alpha/beta hydrolase [Halalkalibacter oceani]